MLDLNPFRGLPDIDLFSPNFHPRPPYESALKVHSYLPGALAQSAALNDLHPTRRGGQFPSGVGLEEETDPLRRTFDLVIGVELIEGDRNAHEIRLLGRPDLHQTFTKLHVLRLAQFASLVFLDADVLPLRPMSHLLNMVSSWPDEYFQDDSGNKTPAPTNPGDILTLDASTVTKRNPHRLHNPAYPCPVSAAPDSGWPDIFNSGVIVLAPPGERGFKQAMSQRSWDGGDQGTLNEWTGSQVGLSTGQGSGGPGWNRLSFKYNVTPTAAYTYAPAYAKFGTGIHAVHFIGPSKPWSGLSFRPPFIASSGREAGTYDIAAYSSEAKDTTPQWRETAYSYHILVDRWYAVYDAHFRAEADAKGAPKSEYEVHKYESAWEGTKGGQEFTAYDGGVDSGATKPPTSQPNQYPHVVPPHTYHVAAPSAPSEEQSATFQPASLEELRRLALHGAGHAGAVRAGEGSYISLPMEGRFTLMRPPPPTPPPEPEPVHTPAEVHHHHHEEFHAPPPPPQEHHHEHHGHHEQHEHHQHHQHHEHHHHHHHHEPPRPHSPPIIAWNPAYEPPPTTAPAADNFPNAWYENQWDMPATKDYHHGDQHAGAPEQFFQPPEPEQYIPPVLINQGQYSELTANGFEPDQARIKPVFPWEGVERPAPTRAFPGSKPPLAKKVKEEPITPITPPPPLDRPPSPPRALGSTYFNAWDDIPSIQRYAARLTGALPPPSKPEVPIVPAPVSSAPQKEWSWERDRGDSGDASSRDGDDEDDEEESESEKDATPKATTPAPPPVSNGKSKTKPKPPPSGSISSTSSVPVGAEPAVTEPPAATLAQTSTPTSVTQLSRASNPPLRGFELYLSEKRKAQGAPDDIRKRLALPIGRSNAPMIAPGNEAQMPVLLQIPISDQPKIAGDVGNTMPLLAEPSFESSRPRRDLSTAIPFSVVATLGSTLKIPSHTQRDSDCSDGELTDEASTGPSSPYEYDHGSAPPPARAWDEARSVDAFKRDSHEALARFLNKGSWGGSSSA
ncbi:unnamed protein product [Rhizoctonia solani]|uniref:Glycosyltransferase family 8 protein n=1 Tax=Rhizoctonia solani TaxID=456999 RepID=A0A8H3GZ97_9AGAM|nr:unnamed protein product [Rhizoctonia solani]